MAMTMVTYSW